MKEGNGVTGKEVKRMKVDRKERILKKVRGKLPIMRKGDLIIMNGEEEEHKRRTNNSKLVSTYGVI